MDKFIRRFVAPLIFALGMTLVFFSVVSCDNGNIEVWECAIGGAFGLTVIGLSFLIGAYFKTVDDNKDLIAENERLQNKIIDLMYKIRTEQAKAYKQRIHTPVTVEECEVEE